MADALPMASLALVTRTTGQCSRAEPTESPNDERCYVHAVVREAVRYTLNLNQYDRMAETIYRKKSADDMQLINNGEVTRQFWATIRVVINDQKDTLMGALDMVESWEASQRDMIRMVTEIVEQLSTGLTMGRVIALIALLGWAAVRLAPRGMSFVRGVVTELETEIVKRVREWFHRSDGLEELRRRNRQMQDTKKDTTRQLFANLAVVTAGAVALAFAYSKS